MVARQYRQGDVLLTPATIPASAQKSAAKGKVVLAEGEATGHAHTIAFSPRSLTVYHDGPQMYLRIKEPVVLEHQEHSHLTIEPGEYLVKRQLEFWLDEVRRVAD